MMAGAQRRGHTCRWLSAADGVCCWPPLTQPSTLALTTCRMMFSQWAFERWTKEGMTFPDTLFFHDIGDAGACFGFGACTGGHYAR